MNYRARRCEKYIGRYHPWPNSHWTQADYCKAMGVSPEDATLDLQEYLTEVWKRPTRKLLPDGTYGPLQGGSEAAYVLYRVQGRGPSTVWTHGDTRMDMRRVLSMLGEDAMLRAERAVNPTLLRAADLNSQTASSLQRFHDQLYDAVSDLIDALS